MRMLEVNAVCANYGQGEVLRGIDIKVGAGEVVVLLGRNGAGKSTTLKSVMGLISLQSGEVKYRGKSISGLSPELICRLGVGYIPENRRIFPGLSVEENLRMGFFQSGRLSVSEQKERLDELFNWFPRLSERRTQDGKTLSGGEQQMLAIARGLAGRPQLLLIDEPSEGLAPQIVDEIFNSIRNMKNRGLAVLLVEQNVKRALMVSDRAYLVEKGQTVITGDAKEWLSNDDLRQRLTL